MNTKNNFKRIVLSVVILLTTLCANAVINGGTITLKVGETRYVDADFGGGLTQTGSWTKSNSTFTFVSRGNKSCTIKGNQVGTGTLYYDGAAGSYDVNYYWTVNVVSGDNPNTGGLTLTATPAGGTVEKGTKVRLTASNESAIVVYTLDNSDPLTSSTKKTIASGDYVTINETCTLKAYARYIVTSDVYTWNYTVEKTIAINSINFPDENFRSYLLEQSYGKDGNLTETEIKAITAINVSNKNIYSLKGIEYFTALETLSCSNNQLTALDMSKNTALTYLSCENNQLTALDVSKNAVLIFLSCSNNRLKTLDVSNTALKTLRCYWNQLQGASMDAFISSLPQNATNESKGLYIIYFYNEGNVCTKTQVTALKTKGWTPYYAYFNNVIVEWLEYEGSEDNSEEPDDSVTPDNPTAPVSIALPDIETVNVNSTIQLTPTLEPADAVTELTWASDDETIAKVTSTGRVAGIKAGTAIISVRTSNGLTAECFVIVQDTSGIVDVKASDNADAPIYNLAGQKVTAPVKGSIYIIGGKKVIFK